jgi:hypothetical protein
VATEVCSVPARKRLRLHRACNAAIIACDRSRDGAACPVTRVAA